MEGRDNAVIVGGLEKGIASGVHRIFKTHEEDCCESCCQHSG